MTLNEILNHLPFYYAAVCILSAVSGTFAITKQFQMFQQNSYFPSRYIKWIKESSRRSVLIRIALFLLIACLNLKSPQALFYLCIGLIIYTVFSIISAVHTQKKSIKKLVFTAKVKRMYGFLIGTYLLLAVLQYFTLGGMFYWFAGLSLLFAVIPQIAVFFVYILTKPIESKITKHYIKDAKKILADYGDRLKVVGITGSYGKTGTKFILYSMLSKKYNTVATPQSFNTPMGVVRTIRENLKNETEIFICEMGAKKKGDIKEICDIVSPDFGIITSVGPQHLDTFGDVSAVTSTKFELAKALKDPKISAFVNGDNEYIRNKLKEIPAVTYGLDEKSDFYSDNITFSLSGQSFDIHLKDETVRVTSKLLGRHSVLNITGAAALAYTLGVSPKEIASAVRSLKPTEHRLEMKPYINGALLIDDAYNANPEGSTEAMRVLGGFEGMKKIAITPGLVELGSKEAEYNEKLGLAAASVCDIIVLVGEKRSEPIKRGVLKGGFDKKNLYVVPSFKASLEVITPLADSNTVILIENDLPDNYLK